LIAALIYSGWERENEELLRAMNVRGYSHCGPVREHWTSGLGNHPACEVFFARRNQNALDTDLRRVHVTAFAFRETAPCPPA